MTDIDVRRSAAHTKRPAPRSAPSPTAKPADAPVAGLFDVDGNRAWIRADGYSPGPGDVAVSATQALSLGLRRGDHLTGTAQITSPHRPATLRLDAVNGGDPAPAAKRPGFYELTALHPRERLRLETGPGDLTSRLIDLVMPIGKGQRALIVAPPKAGKTMVLQAIANAVSRNHPECHLMVVLIDERPEEVTDMRRSVRGEVIAATFDQSPGDHAAVAELAIERAQRLVEDGRDVVVLLDSITRLARAYNLAAPARGRTLSGGLDSTALYPPKRFLGSARAMEEGGSLTIIATALVENGSAMDTVLFEEFKSTGNAELKLDRSIAESRLYPAVDITGSGTRHDEILLPADELALIHQLRRALNGQERGPALRQLLSQLRATASNREFRQHLALTLPRP
jgi:transcription termination factor Rho